MDIIVNGEPVPATEGTPMVSPELGAALADLREAQHAARVRGEVLAEVLAWIENPAIMRPGPETIAEWRERAGLEG